MHKIKTIEISGFRGQEKLIRLDLKDDANFLIGRNGTGKTTLIRLINAALAVDTATLREIRFDRFEIKFHKPTNRKVPTVAIIQRRAPDYVETIEYSVRMSSSADAEYYALASPRRRVQPPTSGQRPQVPLQSVQKAIKARLATIFKLKWISLQRGPDHFDEEDDFQIEAEGSEVDQKLDQVITELVKYFSRLDRQVSEQTALFQKRWFLSFLANEETYRVRVPRLNIGEERDTLEAIFRTFNMSEDSYTSQLNEHFALVEKSLTVINRPENSKPVFGDFIVASDSYRLHSLVEQWQVLQGTQERIYKPRTEFVDILTSMLFRKVVTVNSSNQVTIKSVDGLPIQPRALSSGEKQLLIFLSDALLQEQEPYLFLADEPELSLHVEWQEELVPNLLRINPNAQILFATHSPDIVNVYQENMNKMEELIQ